jgi:hypothetical protein
MKINLRTAFLLVFALLFTLALSSPIEEVESETEDLEGTFHLPLPHHNIRSLSL